jgi:translation initiation factor 2 beta subunit (eIF-2beta)/eIF-5
MDDGLNDADYFELWLSEVTQEIFNKLRAICICGQFINTGVEDLYFYKCKNCGDWMSLQRIIENGYDRAIKQDRGE